MDAIERQMIDMVNRNHRMAEIERESFLMAQRLNAISAGRRRKAGKKNG